MAGARTRGAQGRRQWRKVHLAMDTATSDIRAVEFTPSRDGDSPVLPELLGQVPEGEQFGTVTADGAYYTRRCHTAILAREATPIIPIRKTAACGKTIAQRHASATKACAPPDTMVGCSGNAGRIPRPQPDRGENALPQILRRTHHGRSPWTLEPVA